MDSGGSDGQLSAELTPASSENDLEANRSEPGSLEEDEEDDDAEIDKMLDELASFQQELEHNSQTSAEEESPGGLSYVPPSQPLDQFRFSVCAIEGSGEVDLDALLEDLCIMEKDMNSGSETDSILSGTIPSPNSPISTKVKVSADVLSRLETVQEQTSELTPEEQHERIKAEKIRIALEKLRAARIKKLVVKVYNDEDPTSKTVAIDQTWTAWEVCKKMMRKNDSEPDPNWVLIERIPQLSVERLLEDHESVVDVVSSWPWDSENKLVLNNRREKYALFRNPQNFLLSSDTSSGGSQLAEKSKDVLLQEFFQKDAMRLPELDGVLYLKEGKKSWKKHYFVLRASGVYYTPKGKTKSSRDIVCLLKFEHVSIYNGIGFKKKFKAPTDHCFVLKHPQFHDLDSKAVRCFCAEDLKTMQRWVVGIRLAKFGYKMLVDYSETQDEMDKLAFTLDRNKFTRSSSFTAGQNTEPAEIKPQPETPKDFQSMKARSQAERIKDSIGTSSIHPSGAMSFSVNRSKIEPKKPSKKIGNLFSDAWKKGNVIEERSVPEPISPDTPSGHSTGVATPNTLEPRLFTIDNIGMQTLEEEQEEDSPTMEQVNQVEQVQVVPQHTLVLDPPPLPRKSFSKKQEEEMAKPVERTNSEEKEEQNGGMRRGDMGSCRRSRRKRSESPPPPPPSPPSERAQPPPPPPPPPIPSEKVQPPPPPPPSSVSSENAQLLSSPTGPSGSARAPSPPSIPSGGVHFPSSSSPAVSLHDGSSGGSTVVVNHEQNNAKKKSPPPVPPKSKSRTSSQASIDSEVFRRNSSLSSDQEVFVDSLLPPPSKLLSTSMEEMPPPPPSGDPQDDVDVELPPPPPEVLFRERLSESLSNGRSRTTSGGGGPPAVPPKIGRPT